MKAVICEGFGGSEVLKLADLPIPEPNPTQLLIKVHATALNRADILQRKGKYPPPIGDSDILGLELAGEVAGYGEAVKDFAMGQRVFGLVGGGAYAEYALLDAQMAVPIPTTWNYVSAAAVAETFMTANETIFELGQLQAGEQILIHAGGSGVGTAAIQMAKQVGATVYITAGSEDKIAQTLALGADAGINYKTQDFAEEILSLTDGRGVDVIEDFLGASYLERNMGILKTEGRLIIVALMGGHRAEIKLNTLLTKRLKIMGTVMRSRTLAEKRALTQRFVQRWWPELKANKIKPVIDTIFPITEVKQAHDYMEANQNFGKIVLAF